MGADDGTVRSAGDEGETWEELTARLPLNARVTVADGLIDGLAALHRAIFATGTGPVDDMLRQIDLAVMHLTAARDALANGLAAPPHPRSPEGRGCSGRDDHAGAGVDA